MEKEQDRIYRMMTEQGFSPCMKKIDDFVNSGHCFLNAKFEDLEIDGWSTPESLRLSDLYTTTKHYTDVRPDIESIHYNESPIHDKDLYDPIQVMPKLIKLYNRIYRFIHVGEACTENEYDTAVDDLQSVATCMDFRYKDQLWMRKEVLKYFNELYKKYGDGTVVDPSEWTHDRKYTI